MQNKCRLADLTKDPFELHEYLQAAIFHYPNEACRNGLSSNGTVILFFKSSINVQLCDWRFQVSYCIKYAGGKDEKRSISISFLEKEEKVVEITVRELCNTKVSGAAAIERNFRMKNKLMEPIAEEISLTEEAWFLLKQNYVWHNVDHITVSCSRNEQRGGQLKGQNVYKHLVGDNEEVLTVSERSAFHWARQFSDNQKLHIQEIIFGKYFVDNVAKFNVRPPELQAVDTIDQYLTWFKIEKSRTFQAKQVLIDGPLQNGMGNIVKVRERYFKELL